VSKGGGWGGGVSCTVCKGGGWGYMSVLGLKHINSCRKVPLGINFFNDDICIAFYDSYLSTAPTKAATNIKERQPTRIKHKLTIKNDERQSTYSICIHTCIHKRIYSHIQSSYTCPCMCSFKFFLSVSGSVS
jgi:hypothetical protein